MESMAAKAEAEEMAKETEMAAEGTAMVEAEVVKIAAGAALSKIKVAKITNPAIPLAPTAFSG